MRLMVDLVSSAPVRRAIAAALCASSLITACGIADQSQVLVSQASTCLGSTSPDALSGLFDAEPGGLIAADYQRAIALPDGRTLWLFQDATIRLPEPPPPATTTTTTTVPGVPPLPDPPPPPTERLLHNVGIVQRGTCFDVLRTGTEADPGPWMFADQTTPFGHWFWPLDATMAEDGRLYIFVAEMVERGPLYLSRAEPVSTRIVGVDLATMSQVFVGTPPNATPDLYGFSIADDGRWTYLYAQCHRQFGYDLGAFGVPAHDLSCSDRVTVGRVPSGRVFDAPAYWDGASWIADARRAAPVMPTERRSVNPSQIKWNGREFVAVTKVDDWFGSTLFLDRAASAEGPWTTYARMGVSPRCTPAVCNTYFASWVPQATPRADRYVVGLSHNRWDGQLSTLNRPTFFTVPAPDRYALATRCDDVGC